MPSVCLSVKNILRPQVLISEKDFLVVYKPSRMHSAPLARSSSDNLFDWCAEKFPEIALLAGRRAGEGGLLHRLDFETQGILLVARTRRGMEALIEQQKNGAIVKEYSALASTGKTTLNGFPPEKPAFQAGLFSGKGKDGARVALRIKSAFRPYGFGRKAVRPVMVDEAQGVIAEKNIDPREIVFDGNKPYTTEILEIASLPNAVRCFRLSIYRGFRHQIRCHLAWLGFPILNDDLYGAVSYGRGFLGLRAYSISFCDPSSNIKRAYSIPCPGLDDL